MKHNRSLKVEVQGPDYYGPPLMQALKWASSHEKILCPQKLALTSPTSGGRSVGIVRMRAKGHRVKS
jgi:hypothetical protein